jgi:MFS family permease
LTPEQWGYIVFTGFIASTITSFVGGSVAATYGIINGAVAGVYPAYTGLVSQIVGRERLGGGLGLLNTAQSAFSILGAFIAGVVAKYFGFPTL